MMVYGTKPQYICCPPGSIAHRVLVFFVRCPLRIRSLVCGHKLCRSVESSGSVGRLVRGSDALDPSCGYVEGEEWSYN